VLTGYVSFGLRPRGDCGGYVTLDSTFYCSSSPSFLPHILAYRIPQGGICYKYKYTMHYVIIMCINNNVIGAVINDNY
jgi:hypothetical protein